MCYISVMKKSSKSPKIPIVEVLLATVAIGLVGFIVWYVHQARNNAEETLKQADASSQSVAQLPKSDLLVTTSKLPAGWQVDSQGAGVVILSDKATGCFSQAAYEAGQNAASAIDYQKQTVSAIESKGYVVRDLGASKQSLQSRDGSLVVPGQAYRVTLNGKNTFQNYGTVSSGEQQVTTQTSCPKQTDLTAATVALQAITVNRKLSF